MRDDCLIIPMHRGICKHGNSHIQCKYKDIFNHNVKSRLRDDCLIILMRGIFTFENSHIKIYRHIYI